MPDILNRPRALGDTGDGEIGRGFGHGRIPRQRSGCSSSYCARRKGNILQGRFYRPTLRDIGVTYGPATRREARGEAAAIQARRQHLWCPSLDSLIRLCYQAISNRLLFSLGPARNVRPLSYADPWVRLFSLLWDASSRAISCHFVPNSFSLANATGGSCLPLAGAVRTGTKDGKHVCGPSVIR
jgi:hypothetical protein